MASEDDLDLPEFQESVEDTPLRKSAARRKRPVPKRTGLHGMLDFGSNLSPRTKAGALEETVQEIMDQYSPLAAEYDIERPRDIGVRVRRDLPALASNFGFEVIDDPKETKRLNDLIQQYLRPGKYAVTEREWRPTARALEPFVREGNLKLLMNLGVANGPFLHRLNMRESITAALWMEGLITAPQSAGFSEAKNRRLLLRPLAEMAVAGKKGMGTAFGVGGPQLARAMPYVDIYAASIGLRSGPASKGNRLLTPRLFAEGGPFTDMSRIPRKDLRALENATSGVDVRLAKRDVPARAKLIIDMIKQNMSEADQDRMLSIANTSRQQFAQDFAKDPARMSTKVLATLRSSDPDIDFKLPPQDRQLLADQIQEAVTVVRKGELPSPTRFTVMAQSQGRASTEEAMRALRSTAKKMPGVDPNILKGLGKAPFILALAGIISAGLMAASSGKESA